MHNKPWLTTIILLIGVLYLLQDIGFGLDWWTIRWYTVLFLVVGLAHCCSNSEKAKPKRKKR